ncbi:hypothetical protein RhiirA5_411879 [Rhizophagus irregularis]|uniref:RNase H type-1 domain-containing protein n=1 Tax=Rhizophagus irregularis TaxID=588596 RepID=A0A2N0S6E2_9GLOM|nr:hypothetical protein RhiirA5_411879 [Rhizophagus irregularis]PKC71124.1 hypothetical protein RhiirA1_390814 [Rhizophagus irregularis]
MVLSSENLVDTNTQMGFAWAEISDCYTDNVPLIIFQGATAFNLSSTKAEIYAVVTALILCPNDSEITFYTDSQNVIDTYQKISNKLTSIQKVLKNSNIAWRLIDHIIIDKNLSVTFFKVKAHSGNQFNDLSDELANSARTLPPIEINSTRLLMTPLWDCFGPIDRDIRNFSRNLRVR